MIHWDGKILPEIIGTGKVERLPVLIAQNGVEQLLGVPKLEDGTGSNIATAVYNLLSEWNVLDQAQAICFDTTSSNTGRINGSCILLEQKLERDLLYFACRHHIYELILKAVFDCKMPVTSGPNVKMFDRFTKEWNSIKIHSVKPGIEDKYVATHIGDNISYDVIKFCKQEISKPICRDDYREFLELVIIFLGGTVNRNNIRQPGPTHHARWMGKALYVLKIFLFREHFKLTAKELNGLRDISIFLVLLYVKAWFRCTISVEAPNHDLSFVKDAIAYAIVDNDVSETIVKKMSNHLWYLSEETVALSFFDKQVPNEVKKKMVESLKNESNGDVLKRLTVTPTQITESYQSKDLSNFVTANTFLFFQRFSISTKFLETDPNTWELCNSYKAGAAFCHSLRVVNDVAERAVKLMTEYNDILTNDEQDKQFLLHVVKDYYKRFPSFNKTDLL